MGSDSFSLYLKGVTTVVVKPSNSSWRQGLIEFVDLKIDPEEDI